MMLEVYTISGQKEAEVILAEVSDKVVTVEVAWIFHSFVAALAATAVYCSDQRTGRFLILGAGIWILVGAAIGWGDPDIHSLLIQELGWQYFIQHCTAASLPFVAGLVADHWRGRTSTKPVAPNDETTHQS